MTTTTKSPNEFADLLTAAVRKIKAINDKNLDAIQDELGYALGRDGASYILYLRRGNLPTDARDLETLARALVAGRGLARDELLRFLRAGGHADPQAATAALWPNPSQPPMSAHNGYTPTEGPFVTGPPVAQPRQFFGRERELKRIFNWWRRTPMSHVALVGPKRSGKTSLLHYLRGIHAMPADSLRPDQKRDWLPNAHHYK